MEKWQLTQLQALPLEVKIQKSLLRIKEWYEHFEGDVYVSFSGGKDSTVLLHLVRSLYPDVPAVFADTGLEFPEIRDFVKTIDNVEWLKPAMNFRDVIKEKGYPIISKEVSEAVSGARKGYPSMIKKLTDKTRKYNCTKYKHLLDAPFKISHQCCDEMKKKPFKKFEKETGLKCIVGTMTLESRQRQTSWLQYGCNAFDSKRPMSKPISFWSESDIWDFIKLNNVEYSKVYDMGYSRTGCIWCGFGVHMEKGDNRFQQLKKTHPQLHKYCMENLGLKEVLDYIGVPTEQDQLTMDEYIGGQ